MLGKVPHKIFKSLLFLTIHLLGGGCLVENWNSKNRFEIEQIDRKCWARKNVFWKAAFLIAKRKVPPLPPEIMVRCDKGYSLSVITGVCSTLCQ